MAYFVIEYRENKRRKWKIVDRLVKKKEAEINISKYSKHILREDEHNGMEYRIKKIKGNYKGVTINETT